MYSFDSHSKSAEIVVYDFGSGEQAVISTDVKASEPRWLSATQLVWLKAGDNGNTSFVVADLDNPGKTYTAGTVPGPVSSIKLYHIEDGMTAVAVAALQTIDPAVCTSPLLLCVLHKCCPQAKVNFYRIRDFLQYLT